MSPVYPDRPIRPLPRRSLRERLSPEIADSITYPPAPAVTNPMFYAPYPDDPTQQHGLAVSNAIEEIDRSIQAARRDLGRNPSDADSEDEEGLSVMRLHEEYQQLRKMMPPPPREGLNGTVDPLAQSVASSNDSVDGYDSFENTNNKKKRKIPTSGTRRYRRLCRPTWRIWEFRVLIHQLPIQMRRRALTIIMETARQITGLQILRPVLRV